MAKVMVVDDSMLVREQVTSTLREAGFETVEAKDGLDGLELIEATPEVDLVICDLNMPRMDGLEFLERLRSVAGCATVPVLMLTTEAQSELVQRAKKFGARGWIVKPFNPGMLVAATKKLTAKAA